MDIVTYHYVRPETETPPSGYYHLPLARFRAQLDHLAETRTFLSRSTFFACLRGERSPPADGVVLSFDDGLVDHYQWVLPELERRGLWGVCFVATDPVVDGRRLAVQRVHTLVSLVPGPDLLAAVRDVLRGHAAVSVSTASDDPGMYAGRDTEDSVRTVKRLLNQEVPTDVLPDVLDDLEDRFPAAGAVDAADLYLSVAQLRELSDAGMVVGAHSVSHPLLSRIDRAEQRAEVRGSKRELEELLGHDVDLFAYPYGTENAYTTQTVEIVRSAGFEYGVTTRAGSVDAGDVASRPLALPRRDCTTFAHGESAVSLPER